jgi:hypothetical protein
MTIDRHLTAMIAATLLLAGCSGKPAIELPADPQERAATCYAAKLALFAGQKGGDGLTVEQTNEAAHFLLLGASTNGIAEPTKAKALAARGQAIEAAITERKNAAAYAQPCAKAYPETNPVAFKGLGADTPDTRMMCFALSNALIQIYRASDVPPAGKGEIYGRLYNILDERISNEIHAAGDPNLAELAGRAVRGLALGAQAGPPTKVMDACAARYLKRDAPS